MNSPATTPHSTPRKSSQIPRPTTPSSSPASRARTVSAATTKSESSDSPSRLRTLSFGKTKRPSLEQQQQFHTPPTTPTKYRGRRSSGTDFMHDPSHQFAVCTDAEGEPIAGRKSGTFEPFYQSPTKTAPPPVPAPSPSQLVQEGEVDRAPRSSSLASSTSRSSIDSGKTTLSSDDSSRPPSSSSLATTLASVPEDEVLSAKGDPSSDDGFVLVERPTSPYGFRMSGSEGFEVSIESVVVPAKGKKGAKEKKVKVEGGKKGSWFGRMMKKLFGRKNARV